MKGKTTLEFIENYDHKSDWYFEGQISHAIVRSLKNLGYQILKDNSDNTKARGEDIIAVSPNGITEIIEVKGYPSEYHTKGKQIGHPKPTKPKQQAKHWFSEVILSSIYNYAKHNDKGDFILVLGLPKMERYKELQSKVEDFFTDHNIDIKIYFVDKNGHVTIENLNSKKNM